MEGPARYGEGDPLFGPPPADLTGRQGPPPMQRGGRDPGMGGDPWQGDEPSSLVRPYAVTGGRTRPRSQLPLEALVSAQPSSARPGLTPECYAISEICREWRSVAEISALLRVPLGVVRVLVADMADEGLLLIRRPATADGRPDINLLERVLSGLRKL